MENQQLPREVRKVYRETSRKIGAGMNSAKLKNHLITKFQLDDASATSVMNQVRKVRDDAKSGAIKNIAIGAVVFIIGGGITIASLNSSSGGLITYGAIIFGFIWLIQGIIGLTKDPFDDF